MADEIVPEIAPDFIPEYYNEVPDHNEWELQFAEYENERWEEDPELWSPLITLEQLRDRPDLKVEWYCPDWIPVGAKTILTAEPKCGKTILLFHALNAVVNGAAFLGKPCEAARVLYLTEQTEHEFKRQVKEIPGLLGNPNFFVLLAEDTPKEMRTWEDTLSFVEKMLKITKARIVVFDTFIGLAKLPAEGENDAATIQNNIDKMNFLFKNRYLSVVFTHHNRKISEDPRMRGNIGGIQSARGSSAFAGGAGHIIVMQAPDMKDTKRMFNFYGRYMNAEKMTLDLFDGKYHLREYQRT